MGKEKKNAIVFNTRGIIKRLTMMLTDVLIVNLSYYLALVIRFYVNHAFNPSALRYLPAFWKFAPYYSVACIVVFFCFGLYNNRWRYAGLHDLHWMLGANVVTSVIQIAGTLLFVRRMPITYYAIGGIMQFVLIVASRFAYRFFVLETARLRNKYGAGMNVMIVGAGEMARILRNQIENDASNIARPVCVFSPQGVFAGEMMNGLPIVTGMDRLTEYIDRYRVKCVILADSLIKPELRRQIREICGECKVEVQDFSGYLAIEGYELTPQKLLEHVNGPVKLVVNGLKASFENSEKAMQNLDGNYIVQRVYAEGGKLVIVMTGKTIILNDTQQNWVRDTEEETGKEISFF